MQTTVRRHMDRLDAALLQHSAHLPINAAFACTGVRVKQCSVYASLTKPVRIVFRGKRHDVDYGVINKVYQSNCD